MTVQVLCAAINSAWVAYAGTYEQQHFIIYFEIHSWGHPEFLWFMNMIKKTIKKQKLANTTRACI